MYISMYSGQHERALWRFCVLHFISSRRIEDEFPKCLQTDAKYTQTALAMTADICCSFSINKSQHESVSEKNRKTTSKCNAKNRRDLFKCYPKEGQM